MGNQYKLSGPYHDGVRVFMDHGSKGNDNPYEKDSKEYADWDNGWEEAKFYGGWQFYDQFKKVDDE